MKLLVSAALAALVTACGPPAFWSDLDTPWTLCGADGRTSVDVRWSSEGRVLRLTSEPGVPQLRFSGASMTDEYYSGDGYRLEIQLGGVITLNRPDGSVLQDC